MGISVVQSCESALSYYYKAATKGTTLSLVVSLLRGMTY